MTNEKRKLPIRSASDFDVTAKKFAPNGLKEITSDAKNIKSLAPISRSKEIGSEQFDMDLGIDMETEVQGIGMGVLSDGTPYLNQRGLAAR